MKDKTFIIGWIEIGMRGYSWFQGDYQKAKKMVEENIEWGDRFMESVIVKDKETGEVLYNDVDNIHKFPMEEDK